MSGEGGSGGCHDDDEETKTLKIEKCACSVREVDYSSFGRLIHLVIRLDVL